MLALKKTTSVFEGKQNPEILSTLKGKEEFLIEEIPRFQSRGAWKDSVTRI